jgi:hypothetical protein
MLGRRDKGVTEKSKETWGHTNMNLVRRLADCLLERRGACTAVPAERVRGIEWVCRHQLDVAALAVERNLELTTDQIWAPC